MRAPGMIGPFLAPTQETPVSNLPSRPEGTRRRRQRLLMELDRGATAARARRKGVVADADALTGLFGGLPFQPPEDAGG